VAKVCDVRCPFIKGGVRALRIVKSNPVIDDPFRLESVHWGNPPQILSILRQAEGGVPVSELWREHGMSHASFYKWRSKYGGMPSRQIDMQSPAG
jgi:hypothetical protein